MTWAPWPSGHSAEERVQSWERSSGRGTVFSWTVTHQPVYAAFADVVPYAIVVAELEEGVRIVSNLTDIDPAGVTVGMPVQVYFQTFDGADGDLALHQFRPAG